MKFKLLAVFLLIGLTGYGQSINPQVVSPAGESFSNGTAQLTFTLGEIAVGTLTGGSSQITQGFLQPDNSDVVFTVPSEPVQLCSDAGSAVDLEQYVTVSPSSGILTFSGAGVTGNTFDATAQAGNTVTITATFDPDGAGSEPSEDKPFDIVVTTLPVITVVLTPVPVNVTGGLYNLLSNVSADPTGGTFTFTGTGVTGTDFDPTGLLGQSPVITVDYVLNTCSVSSSFVIDVNEDPQLTVEVGPVELCVDAGTIDLNTYVITAVPAGGVLTFNGSSDANFDPAANIGTTTIDVQYVVNGETLDASFDINVTELPVVTVVETGVSVSVTGGLYDLSQNVNATPDTGTFTFTGNGVTGSDFDPTQVTVGVAETIDVTYTLGNCTVEETFTVTAVNGASITILDDPILVCETSGEVNLEDYVEGNPSGGTFSFTGGGVTTSPNFDPAGLSNTVQVTAEYTVDGETVSATLNIEITAEPTLTLPTTNTEVSQFGGEVDLLTYVEADPTGGVYTFSGPASLDGSLFDPTGLNAGSIVTVNVDYELSSCTVSESFDILITDDPFITVPTTDFLTCETGAPQELTALVSAQPEGGTFTFDGDGVTGTTFDPSDRGRNTPYEITVTYTTADGTDTKTFNISVGVEPTFIVLTPTIDITEDKSSINLEPFVDADPGEGTYVFSGIGVDDNRFNPDGLTGMTITVTVTYTLGACTIEGTILISVTEPTGIPEELELNDLKYYPNPVTNNTLTLETDSRDISKIQIYSFVGKKVLEMDYDYKPLNLELVPQGIYYILLQNSDDQLIKTFKIIKQ